MVGYVVQGQEVTTPVRIRDATACSALFAVPARAAQQVIGYSGLRVTEPVPGRALCSLAFVRYTDGDLGPYHEFAVAFGVHGSGVFIHWLPVNQEFTLEAGRTIWGFPKELAEIELDMSGHAKRCRVLQQGEPVVELTLRPGVPVPSLPAARRARLDAYSCLGGVVRRTAWEMNPHRVRARPGGAVLRLGRHPIADELRSLGLPRRAMVSSTVQHVSMSFEAPQELAPTARASDEAAL
jgi:Acetoacetate decarboxylase (ADC)